MSDDWFQYVPQEFGITLIREPRVHPIMRCNIWHVRDRDCDLLVDSGMGLVSLRRAANELFEHDIVAVATHSHADHVGGMHEFADRRIHPLEAAILDAGDSAASLRPADEGEDYLAALSEAGYDVPETYLLASPSPGYDPGAYSVLPAPPTALIEEGDVIALKQRRFEVLHLPGHSPGSIGLWEAETGILFSGDAIYDGPLLDNLPESDISSYTRTMTRLLDLPVEVVHGGHEGSFGRDRLRQIAQEYLKRWDG